MKPSKHSGATRGLSALVLTLGVACGGTGADPSSSEGMAPIARAETLELDVAENVLRFVFDDSPVYDDGYPAYGNAFITQGYVYPHGFLDEHAGVNEDGSPSAPEEVLGEWTCRGVLVGEGSRTVEGPWVLSTQHIALYEEPGYDPAKASGAINLVTEGYEIPSIGVPVERAITGGTGPYRAARGSSEQVLLGFDESQAVQLRFRFEIEIP